MPKHLILFDFSGTLSLNAVLFGQAERLTHALRDSGLWRMGLNRLDDFWNGVIAPTWAEGAATPLGYAEALTKGLRGHLSASGADIRRCAQAFAAEYFAHFTIHPAWTTLLQAVCADPSACVCIATDHYADATELIRAQLAALGIPAHEPPGVFIANSADIGAFKAERAFWEHVRTRFTCEQFYKISLIDDFGANEPAQDRYAADGLMAERQAQTTALLREVFRCPVEAFPFAPFQLSEFADCVARAAAFLHRAGRC